MKAIDIILAILLIIGAWRGYKKGLLMEIVGIIAFFAAIILAFKLLHWGTSILNENFGFVHTMVPFIAFIFLFIGIILLANLAGKALKGVLDITILGMFDNLAGAIVGILKWALGISIIIFVFGAIGATIPPENTENAYLYPLVAGFAPLTVQYVAAVLPFVQDLVNSVTHLLQKKNP